MAIGEEKLVCDGCGQAASAEHLAGRLRRLEGATRWRPLHIQTLLLGAASPARDADFIYSDATNFGGEAAAILEVVGIESRGKSPDAVHHELQRAGVFVSYVLECPLGPETGGPALAQLLAKRIPATLTRIRRSIKPKRVALISPHLDPFVEKFSAEELGCDVILDGNKTFSGVETGESFERLRAALSLPTAAR
jgi:hypothetical protein